MYVDVDIVSIISSFFLTDHASFTEWNNRKPWTLADRLTSRLSSRLVKEIRVNPQDPEQLEAGLASVNVNRQQQPLPVVDRALEVARVLACGVSIPKIRQVLKLVPFPFLS